MAKKSSSAGGSERRKAQRLAVAVKIVYRIQGECKDISGKGVRLTTKQPLTPGDEMEVIIQAKGLGVESFETLSKVVWCKQSGKDRFEAGLSFIKIKNQEKFMEFLCEKMIDVSLEKKPKL